jgi:hypothetical protein
VTRTRSGPGLRPAALVGLAEIVIVFLVAWAVIAGLGPRVGDGALARQGVAWVANVVVLIAIGVGLRLRGQGWADLGVGFGIPERAAVVRVAVRATGVAVLAVASFVLGAIIMANVAVEPQAVDTSGYGYLRGNPGGLVLALVAVWVVSSFGEEVIYRGFLMTRLAELGGGTRTAWVVSLLASAVVFGLVHYAWGVAGMVQTGLMGLALGSAWLRLGRNLWVTITAHAILDTMLLVQQYLA